MKKTVSFLATGLVLFAMGSCMSEEYADTKKSNEVGSTTITKLEKLNSELLTISPENRDSRGWSNWTTKQKVAVITADCGGCWKGGKYGAQIGAKVGTVAGQTLTGAVFGGFIGGVAGGAFASWIASPESVKTNNETSTDSIHTACFDNIVSACENIINEGKFAMPNAEIDSSLCAYLGKELSVDQHLVTNTNLNPQALRVGMMHNALLAYTGAQNTIGNGNNGFLDRDSVNVHPIFEESLNNQKQIFKSQDLQTNCKLIGEQVGQGNLELSNQGADRVIALFLETLDTYSSEVDDIAFVISKYEEILNSASDITDDEKQALSNAFATALYSSKYWQENE